MNITWPKEVESIIDVLSKNGYEAYAVGGCIRDSILGRTPDDWDITTSAKPEEVKALFKKTIDTGIKHGTVTILIDKKGYEVTTFRIDGEYEDSRRPKNVIYTSLLEEDLKRRDFTINAMAYNKEKGLIDLFGGLIDIKEKKIRCVGNPSERFQEDALRIMRAVRFSAQLGYNIEDNTREGMIELAHTLSNISAERIQVELTKLLISDHPDYIVMAYECNITKNILPEFDAMMECEQNNPHHCFNVGNHTTYSLKLIDPDKILRYTMLLHDIGKVKTKTTDEKGIDHFYGHAKFSEEMTSKIMQRLKMDNYTKDYVKKLVYYHDYDIGLTETRIRKCIAKIGNELFPMLLKIKRADILSQSKYMQEEKLKKLDTISFLYKKILDNEDCTSLKELAITGSDLIEYGMKPGVEIGTTLKEVLDLVLEKPELNNKKELLNYIFNKP
ncbi:MAG: CCA tRNA nucleotidyltransferase [Lachnospiraceae bacterium]